MKEHLSDDLKPPESRIDKPRRKIFRRLQRFTYLQCLDSFGRLRKSDNTECAPSSS